MTQNLSKGILCNRLHSITQGPGNSTNQKLNRGSCEHKTVAYQNAIFLYKLF